MFIQDCGLKHHEERLLQTVKKPFSIEISPDLLQTAYDLGLNAQKVCENALIEIINRLTDSLAGGARFELATTGLGGLRPIRTRLPAHKYDV
jgi:hypothetical protein